jgi:hypothetical protein
MVEQRAERSTAASNSAPAVHERSARLGRGRELIDKTAISTWLRKNEVTELRAKHLTFERQPYAAIELAGELKKNGEEARILLVRALTEDLHAWVADENKGPDDRLSDVPRLIGRVKDAIAKGEQARRRRRDGRRVRGEEVTRRPEL